MDVDYPQLIERKRDRMLTDALLRDPLLKTNLRSSEPPIYLRSDKYLAVGCDLRDLDKLEQLLKTEFDVSSSSILFVAEVSVTYMPLRDADALIKWASKFDDGMSISYWLCHTNIYAARFCVLEQYLPQGPDHPFAQTMLRHFDKLQASIQSVKEYSSLALQKGRFTDRGWSVKLALNLWELWSDEEFTPSELRRGLDAVEPFDEWEEFALFAGHYFLLVASNAKSGIQGDTTEGSDAIIENPNDTPGQTIVLTHVPSSSTEVTPRRFGAAFSMDHDNMAVHGGHGLQQRLTSMDVLHRNGSKKDLQPLPMPQARVCHTVTSLDGSCALLVGGRTSPSHTLPDCWYMKERIWQKVEDLSPGRFRHSSVRFRVPYPESESELEGVLVFGGKTGTGCVLDECAIWRPNHGWQIVPVVGTRPAARFGAAISSVGADWGFLLGGMQSDGTVLDDIWEYKILPTPELRVQFKDRTQDVHRPSARSPYARFGASLIPFGNNLLLVGGVASKQILSLPEEFVVISTGAKIHVETPSVSLPHTTWPLLIGAGIAAVSEEEAVIAGGGAVCFSMGSFWNDGYVTVTRPTGPDPSAWSVSVVEALQQSATPPKPLPKGKSKVKPKNKSDMKQKMLPVPRIQLKSAEDFSRQLEASKPAIIEGLNLGPCTELWTLDYLKEKLGVDREIVIHECSSDRMTFKDKNFLYVRKSVGDFLDGIAQGSQTYLRAVSASQPNKLPTKLEEDFPTIAADFILPDVLSSIKETYHSSPLRISGPVSLWLHYDVLANVLCQVVGTKTLRMYPPSDVKYLDYPAGGSSSNTNVLMSQDRRLHPHTAFLKPGDVLFIPPMWSHTATPEDGYSVAVNVFFKNLAKGYAAGKDVYGNRDLQAYENGRRDIEKIVKAFKGIPDDISNFYLERLVAELQGKADERK